MGFLPVAGRKVAIRPPGRSLAVLPFLLLGGVPAVFLSGLLLHLATTVVGGQVLARLGRSPVWAVLLLCHPTLAVYSRTLMADAGAGLGILLAALAVVAPARPLRGAWAGAAVALGALMRYHAGLALPFVAASFCLGTVRPRPRREFALCLLTGGLGGGLIVAYNLSLYHRPTDASPSMRGLWSPEFLVPQARFYASALMVIWPGMLLAPLLDRSNMRWLVRGVCGLYAVLYLFYYWHDEGSGWFETAVVGQRLLLVVLPLWVVSYAGVLDELVTALAHGRLGQGLGRGLAAAVCLVLLAATGLMFARHQGHLRRLLAIHDAVAAVAPEGAPVIVNPTVEKLFGVPTRPPSYRLIRLADVARGRGLPDDRAAVPTYLAAVAKTPADTTVADARAVAQRFGMAPVPTDIPGLLLYASRRAAIGALHAPYKERTRP
jgi:hypothetical protein